MLVRALSTVQGQERMQHQAWLTGETEPLKEDCEPVKKNQSPSRLWRLAMDRQIVVSPCFR